MDFKSLLIGALGSALLFVSVGAGIDNHADYGEVGQWMPVATSERVYIVNTKTGESSWEQPKLLQTKYRQPNSSSITQDEWKEQWDSATGRMYWYNSQGETTWENPNRWTEARDESNRPYWYNDNGETTWTNPNQ